ncbi:MAG: aldehyde dehydrogenase [Proteobacteria bacterium]|nr:aldehyde dehydrogenase [Pseudomonadota bacterium]
MDQKRNISELLASQRTFFEKGTTLDVDFRLKQLKRLKQAIVQYEQKIFEALHKDLRKSGFEAFATEVGIVLDEISNMIKQLRKWSKPEKVKSNLLNFSNQSIIYNDPYGVSLIIAPWNYPFQLQISPLIGAIAAGNTAICKPSELAEHTSHIIAELLDATFESDYIAVVEGGIEVNQELLAQDFDFIFFTGSVPVGKIVMEAAAKNLTPVVLELGGKSPALVTKDADLDATARKLAFGKYLNAGQICIAPDYLLVEEEVKKELIDKIIHYIEKQLGTDPLNNPEYVKIINQRNFERISGFLNKGKIVFGGSSDKEKQLIAPTIIDEVSLDDPIMQEEIFGPLLPVLSFRTLDEAIKIVRKNKNPLALYLFTRSTKVKNKIMQSVPAGGGCVNEVLMHVANPNLPFGGIKTSGIGRYHGKASFDTFSNKKGMVISGFFENKLRYPPYKDKLKLVRKIMK